MYSRVTGRASLSDGREESVTSVLARIVSAIFHDSKGDEFDHVYQAHVDDNGRTAFRGLFRTW